VTGPESRDLIPHSEGNPPPPGYVLGKDQQGVLWWVRPGAVKKAAQERTELTPAQIGRIRTFKEILWEHDHTSLEEAADNFRRDRNPEAEIQLWEHVAHVYQAEVEDRPLADARERKLLFRALFALTFSGKVEDVIAMQPQVKALADLPRVIDRFRISGTGNGG
jgi:hypothetical protein